MLVKSKQPEVITDVDQIVDVLGRPAFSKVKRGIVGLQFAGTDVEVLEAFLDRIPDRILVMNEQKGTFHPKLLIGIRGNNARAIIGSSNFTRAAFSVNYEINLLLHGNVDTSPISDLLETIKGYSSSEKDKRQLDATLLAEYREKKKSRPPRRRLPPSRRGPRQHVLPMKWSDLDVEWDDYFALIKAQDGRKFLKVDGGIRVFPRWPDDDAYLTELRRCREAFKPGKPLRDMSAEDRKIVAGYPGTSLGWFGSIKGAGTFKNLIKSKAKVKRISHLLDEIPAKGDFDDQSFIEISERALDIWGVRMACWTRLLAMKRPDLFLPVNGANEVGLQNVYGSRPGTARSYLEMTRNILDFPWADPMASPPVDEVERESWEARVAMLDTMLYDAPARRVGRIVQR